MFKTFSPRKKSPRDSTGPFTPSSSSSSSSASSSISTGASSNTGGGGESAVRVSATSTYSGSRERKKSKAREDTFITPVKPPKGTQGSATNSPATIHHTPIRSPTSTRHLEYHTPTGKGNEAVGSGGGVMSGGEVWGLKIDKATFPTIWFFLSECVQWLRRHEAQKVEGLFRVAGDDLRVDALQTLDNNLSIAENEDPHVITSLLKRYFRSLADPLLTFKLYPTFIGLCLINEEGERKTALKKALGLLPKENHGLLKFLISYFPEVTKHSAVNQMDAVSLGIAFGPCILRPEVENPLILIMDIGYIAILVSMLIENFDFFLKQNQILLSESDKADFENQMRKLYTKHSLSSIKALKGAKTISGNEGNRWKKRLSEEASQIREGQSKFAQEMVKAIIEHQQESPSHSPRKSKVSSKPNLVPSNQPILLNVLTSLISFEELKVSPSPGSTPLLSTTPTTVATNPKPSKVDVDFSETETSERSFVVVVTTYEEEELNASSSSHEGMADSDSDEDSEGLSEPLRDLEVDKLVRFVYPDENLVEEEQVKRMVRSVFLPNPPSLPLASSLHAEDFDY